MSKNCEVEWTVIHAPAKVNLTFEVLRRREDGFHEIRSLVTPISIFDTISVRPSAFLTLQVEIPAEKKFQRLFAGKRIPTDEKNLIIRAAKLLQRQIVDVNFELPGADIILEKRIPAEAGLGGGSGDAAATMIVLNELWKLGFSREKLAQLGAELGSDVPLFLRAFPVICRGRGEILEPIPDGNTFPKLSLVVVKPDSGCSTPEVFRRCTPRYTEDEQKMTQMIHAWRENRLTAFAEGLKNDLTEPAMSVSPDVKQLLEMFRNVPDPCLGFSLTGSGSACFGLCRSHEHALKVADFFEHNFIGTVFVAETELFPL
ncbi:MAG: 4-(cytidine 5'-diphospho)-2-C-methyl-D-erythritol kinase [Planctomycetia bacterium]|nr:4-(cytidine 5'-diphospho)-2-C-methyl-D-erythritol kinase [Planctomycetia bacterium]